MLTTYFVNSLVPLIEDCYLIYYSHSAVCQNYAPIFPSYERTPLVTSKQICIYLVGEMVVEALGMEVVEVELGQGQVDFDVHNNHLILDCSHQCNLLTFDCSNHSLLIGSRNS